MHHYTYLLVFPNGMKYIGAHSTHISPELDACYLGSGRYLPKRTRHTCTKEVLQVFETREECMKAELAYIDKHACVEASDYYNHRRKTFDKHGCDHTEIGKRMVGLHTAETNSNIKRAIDQRKQYVGENRTPAQKHADAQLRGRKTGPNPNKGHSSISNTAFVPWYYITPAGKYVEIFDTTKKEMSLKLGFYANFIAIRCSKKYSHTPVLLKQNKGWIFGNLPRPTTDML